MKVGDYVRNENGLIGKIIGFKGDMVETDNERLITYKSNHSECKIKERPIDLVEVGDYVNGVKVLGFEKDNTNKVYLQCGMGTYYVICTYFEEEIKSIVTREQFESMKYEVNE